jgi:thioredoxin 1
MLKVTKENFESLLAGDTPLLLDFYADWCGPCRMLSPIIEQIAAEHPEITVGKVNVDEEGELAAAFGVVSIPMLAVLKSGKVAATSVGVRPKAEIEQMLKA